MGKSTGEFNLLKWEVPFLPPENSHGKILKQEKPHDTGTYKINIALLRIRKPDFFLGFFLLPILIFSTKPTTLQSRQIGSGSASSQSGVRVRINVKIWELRRLTNWAMEGSGRSQWRRGSSKWSRGGPIRQWSQLSITLIRSRIQISGSRIKQESRIRIRIKVARRIRTGSKWTEGSGSALTWCGSATLIIGWLTIKVQKHFFERLPSYSIMLQLYCMQYLSIVTTVSTLSTKWFATKINTYILRDLLVDSIGELSHPGQLYIRRINNIYLLLSNSTHTVLWIRIQNFLLAESGSEMITEVRNDHRNSIWRRFITPKCKKKVYSFCWFPIMKLLTVFTWQMIPDPQQC